MMDILNTFIEENINLQEIEAVSCMEDLTVMVLVKLEKEIYPIDKLSVFIESSPFFFIQSGQTDVLINVKA